MKRLAPLLAALLLAGAAYASDVFKTWTNGEKVEAADLNADFTHIHNVMVGGGHQLLVDSDIVQGAEIGRGKIAGGGTLWAKGGMYVSSCTVLEAPCTVTSAFGFETVFASQDSTHGVYGVALIPPLTDTHYVVQASAVGDPAVRCVSFSSSVDVVTLHCVNILTSAPTSTAFTLFVMDDN